MNLVALPGATSCVTPNLAKFLSRLDRPVLEAVAQAAIDRLDDIDGDADLEDGDSDICPAGEDWGTGTRVHPLELLPRPRRAGTLRLAMGARP